MQVNFDRSLLVPSTQVLHAASLADREELSGAERRQGRYEVRADSS